MLISGENAAKLFNAGLFGSGLGTENFDLGPPSYTSESYEAPEQVVADSDIVDRDANKARLPTMEPALV